MIMPSDIAGKDAQIISQGTTTQNSAGGFAPQSQKPPSTHPEGNAVRISARDLAEGGLLADVGVLLDLLTIYLPVIGVALAPAVPAPFAVLALRRGPRTTLVAAAVAAFLVTVISGPHFGWRMGLEGVLGMLLGWGMRRHTPRVTLVAIGTALLTAVSFAAAFIVIFAGGLPIHDVVDSIRNGVQTLLSILASAAQFSGLWTQWLAVRPALTAIGRLAVDMWPLVLLASIIAAAVPMVVLQYSVANTAVRVLGHDVPPFPPLFIVRWATWLILVTLWLPRRLTPLREGETSRGSHAQKGTRST